MRRSLLTALLSLCVFGCPKQIVTTVAGSDDEKMNQLSAQLDELKTRQDVACDEARALKARACGVSSQACEISGRLSDRRDFEATCVAAQEECARLGDRSERCAKQ